MNNPATDAIKAVRLVHAVAEAIRELGEVPSGHLYARMMAVMEVHQFERVIDVLVAAKLVERSPAHLLRWVGPTADSQPATR